MKRRLALIVALSIMVSVFGVWSVLAESASDEILSEQIEEEIELTTPTPAPQIDAKQLSTVLPVEAPAPNVVSEDGTQITPEPTVLQILICRMPRGDKWKLNEDEILLTFEVQNAESYQWQRKPFKLLEGKFVDDVEWEDISGKTRSTLKLKNEMESLTFAYRCIASTGESHAVSSSVELVERDYVLRILQKEITEEMYELARQKNLWSILDGDEVTTEESIETEPTEEQPNAEIEEASEAPVEELPKTEDVTAPEELPKAEEEATPEELPKAEDEEVPEELPKVEDVTAPEELPTVEDVEAPEVLVEELQKVETEEIPEALPEEAVEAVEEAAEAPAEATVGISVERADKVTTLRASSENGEAYQWQRAAWTDGEPMWETIEGASGAELLLPNSAEALSKLYRAVVTARAEAAEAPSAESELPASEAESEVPASEKGSEVPASEAVSEIVQTLTSEAVYPAGAEIAQWIVSSGATEEMLVRALNAASLESVVLEGDALIYVRTGETLARLDAESGLLTDIASGKDVAELDMEERMVYPLD